MNINSEAVVVIAIITIVTPNYIIITNTLDLRSKVFIYNYIALYFNDPYRLGKLLSFIQYT